MAGKSSSQRCFLQPQIVIRVCTFQKRQFSDLLLYKVYGGSIGTSPKTAAFEMCIRLLPSMALQAVTSLGDCLSEQANSHSFSMALPLPTSKPRPFLHVGHAPCTVYLDCASDVTR